jgi:hypothetical protein
MRPRRALQSLLVLLAAAALTAAGGCGEGGDDMEASGDAATAPAAGDTGAGDGGAELATADVPAVPAGQPLATGRSIIVTSEMTVVVEEAASAARRVADAAAVAGGFVSGQEARLREGTVSITIRVPSERHQVAVEEVGGLGEVTEQRLSTTDVTDEVVDLESRIESARTSVARMRGFLDRTEDVGQLASVEAELARRESDLEALLGRQRVLEDQVALSTIHVELREDPPGTEIAGFGGGLRRGWDGFVVATAVLLTVAGFALPFLVVALLVGFAWWSVRRRVIRPAPPAT